MIMGLEKPAQAPSVGIVPADVDAVPEWGQFFPTLSGRRECGVRVKTDFWLRLAWYLSV